MSMDTPDQYSTGAKQLRGESCWIDESVPQCRITDLCRRRAKQTAVHRLLVKKLKKLAKHFQEFEKGPYEEESPMLGIPIGISFFTNQKMDFGFWMTLLGLESNLGLGFS